MPEATDDGLLTLAQVLDEIGWAEKRSAMNRYLADDSTREVLGATPGRASKFPRTRLWLFKRLAEMHDLGQIAPRTAAAELRRIWDQGEPIDGEFRDLNGNPDEKAIEPIRPPKTLGQLRELTAVVGDEIAGRIVEALRAANVIPPPEPAPDQLIDVTAAAELLGLADRPHLADHLAAAVSRRVPPVERGLWSRRMIWSYIEGKRERAEAKVKEREQRRATRRKPAALPPAPTEEAGDVGGSTPA